MRSSSDRASVNGAVLTDERSVRVTCPPSVAFGPIRRWGGRGNWYFAEPLWELRGLLDRLVGGAGLRNGRSDPERLATGDTVGFWRVEAIEPDRLLQLRAEMKLPGKAWLRFDVHPAGRGAIVRQTAVFHPRGFAGYAYWYALFPVHRVIFAGLLRSIAERALRAGDGAPPSGSSRQGRRPIRSAVGDASGTRRTSTSPASRIQPE